MPTPTQNRSGPKATPFDRLHRRAWPILVTVVFVGLGTAYFYRWASAVQGHRFAWLTPDDLWVTFGDAVAFSHGHFSVVYKTQGFLTFPGILIVLAPVAALSGTFNTTVVEIAKNHHVLQQPVIVQLLGTPNLPTDVVTSGKGEYLAHPQVLLLLAPYILLLSCTALFACDALAERLGVTSSRRTVLAVAEAVVLWNVSVFWGHPEDAVAVALVLYGAVFALDERWTGAGWLFGAAIAMQPLVIVLLPIFLVMSGRHRALPFVLRAVIPVVVITIPPLAADVHDTVHSLTSQPAYPNHPGDHKTLWTALAPKLGGRGVDARIGGGPVRVIALVLAVLVGLWARRWKNRPEMLVWAMALALALRCYTESVMTAYYVWPALAVGLVVAARASHRRFAMAIGIAVATTIVAQWHLGEWTWWALDMAGVTGLLIACARPEPPPATEPKRERGSPARAGAARPRGRPAGSQQKKKLARTNRKSARR